MTQNLYSLVFLENLLFIFPPNDAVISLILSRAVFAWELTSSNRPEIIKLLPENIFSSIAPFPPNNITANVGTGIGAAVESEELFVPSFPLFLRPCAQSRSGRAPRRSAIASWIPKTPSRKSWWTRWNDQRRWQCWWKSKIQRFSNHNKHHFHPPSLFRSSLKFLCRSLL